MTVWDGIIIGALAGFAGMVAETITWFFQEKSLKKKIRSRERYIEGLQEGLSKYRETLDQKEQVIAVLQRELDHIRRKQQATEGNLK